MWDTALVNFDCENDHYDDTVFPIILQGKIDKHSYTRVTSHCSFIVQQHLELIGRHPLRKPLLFALAFLVSMIIIPVVVFFFLYRRETDNSAILFTVPPLILALGALTIGCLLWSILKIFQAIRLQKQVVIDLNNFLENQTVMLDAGVEFSAKLSGEHFLVPFPKPYLIQVPLIEITVGNSNEGFRYQSSTPSAN